MDKNIDAQIKRAMLDRKKGIEKAKTMTNKELQNVAIKYILENDCKTLRRKNAISKK